MLCIGDATIGPSPGCRGLQCAYALAVLPLAATMLVASVVRRDIIERPERHETTSPLRRSTARC
jgi:hypothetical protein